MIRKIPAWVALAACAASFAAGAVGFSGGIASAQGGAKEPGAAPAPAKEYAYLPPQYGGAHIPTVAEWQALQLTAMGAGRIGLTKYFARNQMTCRVAPNRLELTCDMIPQPEWKHSLPGGKFNVPNEQVAPAVTEAVKVAIGDARFFFPELQEKDVRVRLYIDGNSIGTYEAGTLKLNPQK